MPCERTISVLAVKNAYITKILMLNSIINRLKNKAFLFSLCMYIILMIDGNDEAC